MTEARSLAIYAGWLMMAKLTDAFVALPNHFVEHTPKFFSILLRYMRMYHIKNTSSHSDYIVFKKGPD